MTVVLYLCLQVCHGGPRRLVLRHAHVLSQGTHSRVVAVCPIKKPVAMHTYAHHVHCTVPDPLRPWACAVQPYPAPAKGRVSAYRHRPTCTLMLRVLCRSSQCTCTCTLSTTRSALPSPRWGQPLGMPWTSGCASWRSTSSWGCTCTSSRPGTLQLSCC